MSITTNNHIPLCAPVLGLASLGHDVCQTSKNAILPSQQTLTHRTNQFAIDSGKIQMGHGEYIVFHELPNNTQKAPTKDTFEQVCKIFNAYAPAAIINREPAKTAIDHCMNRYDLIRANVKKIDPTLEIAFVPRTLYELVLIRKCIREDLKNRSICPLANTRIQRESLEEHNPEERRKFLEEESATRKKNKCWHLCFFEDKPTNEDFAVEEIAHRLNQVLVKTFAPKAQGFTYQECARFTENEISFLNYYYKTTEIMKAKGQGIWIFPAVLYNSGLTAHFSARQENNVSMTVRTTEDAQIIREALALDCCRAAQNHFFIYRGANFQNDHPLIELDNDAQSTKVAAKSISYGASLFAGCAHDVTANPLHFMRDSTDAYIVPVPFDQLHSSPFYIPTTNAIAQLFSSGEFFHARSKIWKGVDIQKTKGIRTSAQKKKEGEKLLKSNFTQEEFVERFLQYKNSTIHLRHPKCIKSPIISKL